MEPSSLMSAAESGLNVPTVVLGHRELREWNIDKLAKSNRTQTLAKITCSIDLPLRGI